jgi:SAM-dependent methyltransferase
MRLGRWLPARRGKGREAALAAALALPLDPPSSGQLLYEFLPAARSIVDLGCGPHGGPWWGRAGHAQILAVDLLFTPDPCPPNVEFRPGDVSDLHLDESLHGRFDLAVADHIFEHVEDVDGLARSCAALLRSGGTLHVGIPDATGFTDRFYRLIHRNGGGHIQQLTRESMLRALVDAGFALRRIAPWPDDWRWLDSLYDLDAHGVTHFTHDELVSIADTFRRELTPERGYFYGWEMVLERTG